MTTAIPTDAPISFEAPGPGEWMLDTTHHGRRPLTAYMASRYGQICRDGLGGFFERMGLPLAPPDFALVQGCTYLRIRGVGEPDTPSSRQPPAVLFKLLSRVHPELRRRNRTAARAFESRIWREDLRQWTEVDRPALVAELRRLAEVELDALDDSALLDHLAVVDERFVSEARKGFLFHSDLLVVGDLLAHAQQWGLDVDAVSDLLRGSSPATQEVADLLRPVAAAISAAGRRPTSVEEIRALGPDVAEAVDAWLVDHGHRLLNSDDLDAATLAEHPELQLTALLAASSAPADLAAPDPAPLRDRVPPTARDRFDEVLTEARIGLQLRDDHVGVRWNWTAGTLRHVVLEVGQRLVTHGRAHEAAHAVELAPDEVGPLLIDGVGPSADELAARRQRRNRVEAAGPPSGFGEPGPPPPIDHMPRPLARAARAAMASIGAMEGAAPAEVLDLTEPTRSGLAGTGIGSAVYEGRACVVASALDALDRVAPGDVLVVPFTSPSYNSLFPVVGAVVTDEGGPMSHAAIMVREFGVAGVVGARGATSRITDGQRVRVDAASGRVELLGE